MFSCDMGGSSSSPEPPHITGSEVRTAGTPRAGSKTRAQSNAGQAAVACGRRTWLAAVAAAPPICALRATALSTALRDVALGLRSPPASRIAATSRIACERENAALLNLLTCISKKSHRL